MQNASWAEFRFYEELNDHLPEARRKRPFAYRFAGPETIEEAIETIGVPCAQVDLVLVNGESVGFDHPIAAGDRVSVYPVFESLDISPLTRTRSEPLRRPAFLLDSDLEALAARMVQSGLDVRREDGPDDHLMVETALAEGRIILTRGRDLLDRKGVTHGYRVRTADPEAQFYEIVDRFDLENRLRKAGRSGKKLTSGPDALG
jgi:hypothetical protein